MNNIQLKYSPVSLDIEFWTWPIANGDHT